jgi:hypothetical protein
MDREQSARCEIVLWREGPYRCELWTVDEVGYLRVFSGAELALQERTVRGTLWERATAIRTKFVGIAGGFVGAVIGTVQFSS